MCFIKLLIFSFSEFIYPNNLAEETENETDSKSGNSNGSKTGNSGEGGCYQFWKIKQEITQKLELLIKQSAKSNLTKMNGSKGMTFNHFIIHIYLV